MVAMERGAYLAIWVAVIAGYDSRNFFLCADSHVATVGKKSCMIECYTVVDGWVVD